MDNWLKEIRHREREQIFCNFHILITLQQAKGDIRIDEIPCCCTVQWFFLGWIRYSTQKGSFNTQPSLLPILRINWPFIARVRIALITSAVSLFPLLYHFATPIRIPMSTSVSNCFPLFNSKSESNAILPFWNLRSWVGVMHFPTYNIRMVEPPNAK